MNSKICKFQHALVALIACYQWLENSGDENPLDELPHDEQEAAYELFRLCADIFAEYGYLGDANAKTTD